MGLITLVGLIRNNGPYGDGRYCAENNIKSFRTCEKIRAPCCREWVVARDLF
jgi:hypothetical protein